MDITIRDFMGCERADFSANPIAIIGGKNAQGKSSICMAVALALTGNPLPQGITKAGAGVLVRTGAAKGGVALENATGEVALSYPKAVASTEGHNVPHASVWAAGLRSIATLPDKERVTALRELIQAEPKREDFDAAASDALLDAKTSASVWGVIERDGWDAAHKRAQDKGRELKAQWDYATGEKYGEKKAEAWMPHGWSAGLEATSKDALEAIVVGARADLEAAIAAGAVSADRLQEMRAKADGAEALREKVAKEYGNLANAQQKAKNLRDEAAAMPKGETPRPLACPHCHGAVDYVAGALQVAAPPPPQEQIDRQALAYKARLQEAADYDAVATKAHATHAALMAELKAAEDAARQLAAVPVATNAVGDVDTKRQALRVAEADLAAWQKKHEADRLHRAVLANQKIVDLLAPDGVRRTVLVRALEAFNAKLDAVARVCGWKPVAITPDLTVEYGGRPYAPSCSESEQFRARVTLQIALAHAAGEPVVIDGADVLDQAGRAGLMNGLRKMGMTAVVGMMANKPETLPPVAAAKCGAAWWVENGITKEVVA